MNKFVMTAVGVVLAVTTFAGVTINVPDDYATIKAALAAAGTGDTILLAAGTYDASGCESSGFMITLDKGVTLKGAGLAPSATIITGGETRQVLKITSADAVVENLTIRDGLGIGSTTGAGCTIQMSAGLVTNCVISGGEPINTTFETAVYATGGRITGCEIVQVLSDTTTSTYAYWQRAPVYLKNATMDHCDVHGNLSSHKYLGVVTVEGASGLVEFCKIHDNTIKGFEYTYRDGAVAVMNGAVLRDSQIYNNTAIYSANSFYTCAGVSTIAGSGITASTKLNGGAVVERCVITNNIYKLDTDAANTRNVCMAAGVMMGYGSVLRNCLVAKNANTTTKTKSSYTWPISGGVAMSASYSTNAVVENCTIADNAVSFLAMSAALSNGWFDAGAITNTILSGPFYVSGSSAIAFSHCRTDTDRAGDGNVTGDCYFANAANGDYHLTIRSSNVRDAATPLVGVTADLDGLGRPFGPAPDIGCYEYHTDQANACDFLMSGSSAVAGEPFGLTAAAIPAAGVYAYVWTFEKGGATTVVTNLSGNTHTQTLPAAGNYSVSLTVLWGEAGNITATAEAAEAQSLAVYQRRTYVAVGGTGVYPYDTAQNAAGSFADAYAAVYKNNSDPGFIKFAAGTYSGANALDAGGDWLLTVTNGVIVEGATANPADTVIDSTGTRAVKIASEGAALRSFTILSPSNRLAATAYCGYGIDLRAGLAENVVVSNMVTAVYATTAQGYEEGVYMSGGTLRNVEIVGKPKGYSYLYAYGAGTVLYAESGLIDACRIHGNTIHERAIGGVVTVGGDTVMTNSVVFGNTQTYQEDNRGYISKIGKTGGIYAYGNATVVGCTVTNNYSERCAFTPRRAGGIVAEGSAKVVDCVIADNTAQYTNSNEAGTVTAGLALYETASARNCLIVRNYAGYSTKVADAGGVYLPSGAKIESCTVADNVNAGSAAVSGVTAAGTLLNTIVWNNSLSGTPASITYCCTPDAVDGEGNISSDPRFRGNDYRLGGSSPCNGKGSNQAWMTGAKDLAGDDRIIFGRVDIGCYEASDAGVIIILR